jgi:chaperonin cofactor prefoldin
MNADESQTPELSVASSVEPEEQSPTDKLVTDSDVKLLLPDKQSPTDEPIELQQSPTDELAEPNRDQAAAQRVADLQRQEQALRQEIATLQSSHKLLSEQMAETQSSLGRLVPEALSQLEQRKQSLQIAVEQLERRQERIRTEMRTTLLGLPKNWRFVCKALKTISRVVYRIWQYRRSSWN